MHQIIESRKTVWLVRQVTLLVTLICSSYRINSQDLDPRAYVKVPINGTMLISGFSHSEGGVLTDPTLPLQDLEAKVQALTVGGVRTFSLFGQTAQALAVLPYGWVEASALVNGQSQSASRSGFADMRFRLSVLLLGGKATPLAEFAKSKRQTIIGSSVTIVAPTGQYFSDKLINLGTRRWSIKPEVALTQPIGNRWMVDFYTGIWFFTNNDSFYPGESLRTQDPLVAFQTHLSYNVSPRMWLAFNSTFYTGGQSSVNEIYKDDRQENARLGGTLMIPVGKRSALKIAYSRGAIVRIGANFSTISVGWSSTWFSKPKLTE
jgi:hypothetical protein